MRSRVRSVIYKSGPGHPKSKGCCYIILLCPKTTQNKLVGRQTFYCQRSFSGWRDIKDRFQVSTEEAAADNRENYLLKSALTRPLALAKKF